jgi:DNA topoisomerase-1
VAEKLRNTPSVCRKCYVHPAILDSYLEGTTLPMLREQAAAGLATNLHDLRPEEAAVLAMLEERLARAQEPVTNLLAKSIRAVRHRAKG